MSSKIKSWLGLSRLHLLYCVAFSLYLAVSGILSINEGRNYVFQLLFLPVPIFFIFTLFDQWKKNNSELEINKGTKTNEKNFAILGIGILTILMSVALLNIVTKNGTSSARILQNEANFKNR